MELAMLGVLCLLIASSIVLFWFLYAPRQRVKSSEFQQLGAAIENLKLEMGKAMTPPLREMADTMADFLEQL